jgi:hypothetical protein
LGFGRRPPFESFNGRLRDGCKNERLLGNLKQVRQELTDVAVLTYC